MAYIIGNSGLMLPKLTGKMSSNRDFSVQAISEWCNHLPLSDIAGSTKALFLTLQDSHQAHLTYQERFEILSLLRPTLKYLTQALQKIYEEQEVLDDNHRAIADLVNALHFEFINGYKLVIDEASQHVFMNKHIFISSLQQAISYCAQIIFYASEQHRTPPDGSWLELHLLFTVTKKSGVANKTLKKYLTWQSRFNTIADIYKHCLLFAISNPSHLRRAQIVQLLYSLENWAPLLELKDTQKIDNCLFVVVPTQDGPPRYIGLFQQLPPNGHYLDLTRVNERISKLISVHAKNNHERVAKTFSASELTLPLPYLESLHQSYLNLKKRRTERVSISGDINVCLGISTCHWYVSQALEGACARQQEEIQHETINMDSLAQPGQNATSATNKYERYLCQLVNQSEKGYCINWTEKVPPQLQNGEIIGLEVENPNHQKHWVIGTIRWLKNEGSYSTLVGIELISKEVIPVKARLSESASSYLVPTLILRNEDSNHLPKRMVTPPLPFKSGNELEIEFNSQVFCAVLQKSFSASPSYQEFGLHFVNNDIEFPKKALFAYCEASNTDHSTVI